MSAALESPVLDAARPSADLNPDIDRIVEDARSWCVRPVRLRDRLPGLLIGGTFLAFALGLLLWFPAVRAPSLYIYALFIAAYAGASRVEFQVGPGFALPTQIVFVPMLFVLPLRTVPLCVAAALLLGDTAAGRGRLHVERVPLRLANAWHSVGPVLVLGAAGAPGPALRHAPAFVAALAAQFAFDFVSISVLEWFRVGLSPRTLARFIAWMYVVDIALSVTAVSFAVSATQQPAALLLTIPLIGLLAFFARERRVRIDHALELSHAYRGTALLLGDVVEADDEYTGGHSRDVVGLVLAVCDRMGLDSRERRDAEFAALLHDVGKVRVPADIINKTGPLDDAESEIMRRHTIEGERMLDRVGGLLGDVGRVVRSSHEHWDGTGYPDELAGESIPLGARIVAACDAFSAMTTDRPYRDALSHNAAVAELRSCSGTQFDPRVVDVLCEVASAAPRAL
jgi:HD-GYP domain-containing protein (c-di-GMP phosphodiesterase class II)